MALLDDVSDLLSSGGVGAVGGTAAYAIYKGLLPASPDKAVAVIETGGVGPVHAMSPGPGLAVAERPRVQVLVRADAFGYSTGRDKMNAAYKLVDGLADRTLNGVRYLYAVAVQPPFLLEYDANNRPVLACNFEFWKALS